MIKTTVTKENTYEIEISKTDSATIYFHLVVRKSGELVAYVNGYVAKNTEKDFLRLTGIGDGWRIEDVMKGLEIIRFNQTEILVLVRQASVEFDREVLVKERVRAKMQEERERVEREYDAQVRFEIEQLEKTKNYLASVRHV